MSPTPLRDALITALGPAIRYLREQRGEKQVDLARRAAMGKSQLSLYESGRRAPNFESLLRILVALQCDFHDLHNAIQVVEGTLDQVCSGRLAREEEKAAEKFAQGITLLLKASHRTS